ncbi:MULTISPECIES: hypothetical protein [Lysobacter]|uniref:Lipoprotein n=1 Tax=Lysobacter firmicutimachus TaxID=1792846 RepID=A0ABU8D869_9GAMM|nr:hypothetical protein [Lysobacter antibioticus]
MQAKWVWGAALAALFGGLLLVACEPLRGKLAGWFGQDATRSATGSASVPGAQRSGDGSERAGRSEVRDQELLNRHLTDHDPGTPARAAAEEPIAPADPETLPEAERMAYVARERFGPRVAPTPAESVRSNIPRARIEKQRDGRYWVITDDGPARPDLPPGTIVERDPGRR